MILELPTAAVEHSGWESASSVKDPSVLNSVYNGENCDFYSCWRERGGEGQTDRQRQRQRERHKERNRGTETDRQGHRQTDRQ